MLCQQATRRVGEDNIVTIDHLALQVRKQPGRRTCAGLDVVVRHHLDGRYSIWRSHQRLGVDHATAGLWTPPRPQAYV